jgi:hypothetical protein
MNVGVWILSSLRLELPASQAVAWEIEQDDDI